MPPPPPWRARVKKLLQINLNTPPYLSLISIEIVDEGNAHFNNWIFMLSIMALEI